MLSLKIEEPSPAVSSGAFYWALAMNKRRFLKSLFGLAGAAVTAPVMAKAVNTSPGLPAGHPYAGMTPQQVLDHITSEIPSVGQSKFLIAADRFAVIDSKGGATEQPFVIDGGQAYLNEAYVGRKWAVKVQTDPKGRRHIAGIGIRG